MNKKIGKKRKNESKLLELRRRLPTVSVTQSLHIFILASMLIRMNGELTRFKRVQSADKGVQRSIKPHDTLTVANAIVAIRAECAE